jgi:hypothetical protein
MSPSLLDETLMPLGRAARLLPSMRNGKPVSPATLWRWYKFGCRAAGGRVVKLQTWVLGGRRVTSREAIERFIAALSDDTPLSQPAPASTETEAEQLRAVGL